MTKQMVAARQHILRAPGICLAVLVCALAMLLGPSSAHAAGSGLSMTCWDNMDFTGASVSSVSPTVNYAWDVYSCDPAIGVDTFSARWVGTVDAPKSGTYTFYTMSDDGVRLWVDDQLIVNNWTDHGPTENSGTISLTAGVSYRLKLEFYENGGGATMQMSWLPPGGSKTIVPQAQLYPNTQPTAPTALAQYRSDGITTVPTGGWLTTNSVVLRMSMSDINPAQVLQPFANLATTTPSTACGSTGSTGFLGAGVNAATAGASVSGSVTVTGLVDSATYYWRACTIDQYGAKSTFTSRGGAPDFRVDTAAPSNPAQSAIYDLTTTTTIDADYATSTTDLSAAWGSGADATSLVATYDVCFSTVSVGCTNIPGTVTQTGLTTRSATATATGLASGTRYYTCIKTWDNAGLSASGWGCSDGFLVDIIPPVAPTSANIFDLSTSYSSDVDWRTLTTSLSMSFNTGSDSESGLANYDVCFSTLSNDCSAVSGTSMIGPTTSRTVSLTSGSLAQETWYYSCVRARDVTGNVSEWSCSDGFIFDSNGPTIASVYDMSTSYVDKDWSTSPSALSMSWSIAADGNGIGVSDYESCFSYSATSCNTLQGTFVSSGLTVRYDTDSTNGMSEGGRYYTCARATDLLGNVGPWKCSNGFVIDTTAPGAPASIYDLSTTFSSDKETTASSTALSASWSIGSDATSGVANYDACFSTNSSGCTSIAGTTMIANNVTRTATATATGMLSGTRYYTCVRSRDVAGNLGSWRCSNGFVVDTAGPGNLGASSIYDMSTTFGGDLDWSGSSTTLKGSWQAASDSIAGVRDYSYCFSTTSGSCVPAAGTTLVNGNTTRTANLTVPPLADATRLWLCVQSWDNVGNPSGWGCSNSFTIDITPPPIVTTLTSADVASGAPVLSWTPVVDALSGTSYYRVYRSSLDGTLGTQLNSNGATTAGPFTDTTVTQPGWYFYTVVPVDNVGNVQGSGYVQEIVTYNPPLYLRSTTGSVTGSWTLNSVAGTGANTTTEVQYDNVAATTYRQFTPGAANAAAVAALPGTPNGKGWIYPQTPGTAFDAGNWQIHTRTNAFKTHIGYMYARLWKVTLTGSSIATSTSLTSGWVTNTTDIGASTATTASQINAAVAKTSFTAGQYLYLELWEQIQDNGSMKNNTTLEVDNGTASSRIVTTLPTRGSFRPNAPTSLAQYRSDGVTALASGTWLKSNSEQLKMRFNVSDPDSSQTLTPWIEVRTDTNFQGICGVAGPGMYSGSSVSAPTGNIAVAASVTMPGQTDAYTYYWRACAVDQNGTPGTWTSRGGVPDFAVDAAAPASLLAAEIFDGDLTAANDNDYAPSSSALAGSWAAAADGMSGVSTYDACISTLGTTCQAAAGSSSLTGLTSRSAQWSGLLLTQGATYFSCVRPRDLAGNIAAWACSDGFVVDATAPVMPSASLVYDMATTEGVDLDGTTETANFTATWAAAADSETSVRDYDACFSSSAGTCTPIAGTAIESSLVERIVAVTATPVAPGTRIYTCIRAWNFAGGVSSWVCSDGFVVDATAPVMSAIFDISLTGSNDLDVSANGTSIPASWTAATDPQTSITSYDLCISTTSADCIEAGDTVVLKGVTATSGTVSSSGLTSNTTYYSCVRAWNTANLASAWTCSDGFLLDSIPPPPPTSVIDGTTTDLSATASTSSLSAKWQSAVEAGGSGIGSHRYCFTTTSAAGAATCTALTASATGVITVPTSTVTDTTLGTTLISGTRYYACVQSIDLAGNTSTTWTCSNGIIVDTTAPTAPAQASIFDLSSTFGPDKDYTSSTTSLVATWLAGADPESGIQSYDACFSTSSAGCTPIAGTSMTSGLTARSSSATASGMNDQTTYYTCIRATNAAGLVGAWRCSDGFTVDVTGPTMPPQTEIWDMSLTRSNDLDVTSEGTAFPSSWNAASDPTSGIRDYDLCISTSASSCSLASGSTITTGVTGLSATASTTGVPSDTTYYTCVRAWNMAGVASSWRCSDGFLSDTAAPTNPTAINDGPAQDLRGSTVTTSYEANWTDGTDGAGSGMASYDYCISTSIPVGDAACVAINALATGTVPAATTSIIDSTLGTSLVSGTTYYFCIAARDTVGNRSPTWSCSNGLIIDTAPPTNPTVLRDGTSTDQQWSAMTTILSANWSGASDGAQGSGVREYDYCITRTSASGSATCTAIHPSATGTVYETSVTDPTLGIELVDAATYYTCVRARDWSGLEASTWACTDGQTIDGGAPSMPTLVSPADGAVTSVAATLVATYIDSLSPGRIEFRVCSDATCSTTPLSTGQSSIASSGANGSWTMASLLIGTRYWQARGIDSAGNVSTWSPSRDLLGSTAPQAPTLTSPANGVWVTSRQPTLQATFLDVDAADTGRVEFQVCSDSGCASVVASGQSSSVVTSGTTVSWQPVTQLSESTSYLYWRARGIDRSAVVGAWSAPRTMRIDATAPSRPANLTLTNNGQGKIGISWAGSTDAVSGVATYIVEYYASGAWQNACTVTAPTTTCEKGGFGSGTTYVWRVLAIDAAGNQSSSNTGIVTSSARYYLRTGTTQSFLAGSANRAATSTSGSTMNTNTQVRYTSTSGWFLMAPGAVNAGWPSPTIASPGAPGTAPQNTSGSGWVIDSQSGKTIDSGAITVTMSVIVDTGYASSMQCALWIVTRDPTTRAITGNELLGKTAALRTDNGLSTLPAGTSITYPVRCAPATLAQPRTLTTNQALYLELWVNVPSTGGGNTKYLYLKAEDSTSYIDTPASGDYPLVPDQLAPSSNSYQPVPMQLSARYRHPTSAAGTIEYQMSTDASFSTIVEQSIVPGSVAADTQISFQTSSSLVQGTTYYWRVRGVETQDRKSAWTTPEMIVIAGRPPAAPVATSPADAASTQTLPLLAANAFADPDPSSVHQASEWQVRASNESWLVPAATSGTSTTSLTSWTPGALAGNTTYAWRVRYRDESGLWSSWSIERTFTIRQPPAAPTLLQQHDHSGLVTIAKGSDTLDGSAVAIQLGFSVSDPDQSGVLTPWVEVRAMGIPFSGICGVAGPGMFSGAAVSVSSSESSAASVSVSGLTAGMSYVWRACAMDDNGNMSAFTAYGGTPDFRILSSEPVVVGSAWPDVLSPGTYLADVQLLGSGFRAGAVVVLSGTSATLESTRYVSPSRIDLQISVAASAPNASVDITVTNPDATSGTGYGVLSIGTVALSVSVETLGYQSSARAFGPSQSVGWGSLLPGSVRTIGPADSGQTTVGSAVVVERRSSSGSILQISASDLGGGGASIPASAMSVRAHETTGTWTPFANSSTPISTSSTPGTVTEEYDLRLVVPVDQQAGTYSGTMTWTVIAAP